MLALENYASYSVLFCNRGIISFENKSYVLEPLEGATNEHKIYRAENLKIAPGSCGHQLDISAVRAAGGDTLRHSQAGRVGGWGTLMFLACECVSGSISILLPTQTHCCRVPALQNITRIVTFCWWHVLKIMLKIEHILKSFLLFLDPARITCFLLSLWEWDGTEKCIVSCCGSTFWFMDDYSKNLRPHKNTEQCLEKFLPTQDGREHGSCDTFHLEED